MLWPRPFSPKQEADYWTGQGERALPATRLALIAAPVLFLLFGTLWDFWFDSSVLPRTLPVRLSFSVLWLVLYNLTFLTSVRKHLSSVLLFASVSASIAILWMLHLVPAGMLYGSLLFACPQFVLMIMPNTRATAFHGILLLLMVNLWAFVPSLLGSRLGLSDEENRLLINVNFHLLILCVLTYLSAFSNEHRNRRLFELKTELEEEATTDSLSGALNRRYFLRSVKTELARSHRSGRPAAVLLLDIDRFKSINDTYGHPVGDKVIRALSATCVAIVRAADSVGRIGGEEFAVLLPETDRERASLVAQRLRVALESLIVDTGNTQNQWLHFTVSVGVAVICPLDNIESLIQRADEALYRAKASGRNQVTLEPTPEIPNVLPETSQRPLMSRTA